MNFDGKAYIINSSIKTFVSNNGRASVRNITEQTVVDFNSSETNFDISFIIPKRMTNENSLPVFNKTYLKGLVPYTVQVNNGTRIEKLNPINFIITRDTQKHEKQEINYTPNKVYVSVLQPTNIKYNPKTAVVYGSTLKELESNFAGVSVNVNSKVEVIIPDKIASYTDMSIVVQKNSFISIKVPNNISEVLNVPEQLEYTSGYIKGVFTKSGEYNIRLKYQDGEQILNIVVPYYQRML